MLMKGLEPLNAGVRSNTAQSFEPTSQPRCSVSNISNDDGRKVFVFFSAEGTNFVCSASVSVSAGLTPPSDGH